MRLKLLLLFSLVFATQARESRNLLKWLFGGELNEQPSQKSDQVLRIGENVRTLPSQTLLRRTNQLAEGARDSIQTRGLARGRVLNRPAPGGPVRGYKRPPSPARPSRPLDRVPAAPVIFSSYASSVVQGRGQEEQKRIQETFDKYERLNEISDEDVDSEKKEELEALSEEEDVEIEEQIVEEDVENEERVVEATVELIRNTDEEAVVTEKVTEKISEGTESSKATSTTTEQTSRAPAKDSDFTAEKVVLTESPAINEIVEFEIVDDENPYLPAIPENLDGDIHGVHDHLEDEEKEVDEKVEEAEKKIFQAGYKEILPVKVPAGDRYEQRVTRVTAKPQASNNQNVYPLGKPQRPPLKPSRPAQRPEQTEQGSLFDFLPSGLSSLWGSPSRPPVRPRRPIGPPPPPGPGPRPQETATDYHRGLLKVDTDPSSPVRPEAQETPGISSRIDNSLVTEINQEPEAFVVLPSKQRTPLEKKTSPNKIIPKRPRLPPPPPPPQRFPRPPPPRPLKARLPGQGPLPMLSQPVIGLPQVPAGRKQAPFLPKRPLLPPQLPKTFPGAPAQAAKQGPKLPSGPLQKPQVPSVVLKKPLGPPPQKTEQKSEAQTFLKKPLENFPKKSFVKPKPVSLSPVIARLTQQTKVQDKKPFDFRPNGSSQEPSPFISNISSMLNRFLGTTPGPAPAPSLPSLVEETEFADIVTGYKPSDKNETESRGEKETTTTTTPNDKTTTIKPLIKVDEYDDIDSLTAPVPAKPTKLQKLQFPNPNWKKETFKKRPSPPVVRTTTPLPTTTTTTPTPTTTTTSRPTPVTSITTAYPAPIQALVKEYQEKGHVIEQPTYPKPVLQAIQRDFQQKEKIFQQFVTFDETDKAFIPNKEAVNSDWNLDLNINTPIPSLSDKILVYQTLSPIQSTPAPVSRRVTDVSRLPSLQEGERRSEAQSFPHERNAEGGFQPMLRPLHQPLLTQHLAA